jgi:dienelactone hydrolase
MTINEMQVSKTARYFTLGELNANTKQIWIVLHGYAQLANGFAEQFTRLAENNIYVIAPEALHRFYAKGFSGNVGATWMTKEAREHDIKDNIAYLNQLASQLKIAERTDCKIVLLGFSQGVATVTRWFVNANFKVDALIMFAGEMAAELRTNPLHSAFATAKTFFVYGKQDPLLPSFAPDAFKDLFADNHIEVIEFEGKHAINTDVLLQISERI